MIWLILLAGLLLMFGKAYWNTFRPVVREIDMNVDGKDGFNELKIVQLSDLHMERLSISPERMRKLVAAAEPDLIAMTGDYLDRYENVDKFINYLNEIKKVNPKYGIYLVFGNHDHYLGDKIKQFAKAIDAAGCHILQNESVVIDIDGTPLTIIGMDDDCLGKCDVQKSYANVTDEGIHLVLAHDPNTVLKMEDKHQADYILSGHFHGGQFNLIPRFHRIVGFGDLMKKYDIIKGLHTFNGKKLYISEGLGQSGLNVRLRSRPEITVHRMTTGAAVKDNAVSIEQVSVDTRQPVGLPL